MTPELQVALVSGGVGGGVALVASWVGWWLNSRTELKRTRLQIDAQADQTRLQIDAQTDQTRYPDLVRAAGDFAAEMRRLDKANQWHVESSGDRPVDDPEYNQGQDWHRFEPTADVRLLTLEFFADDALRDAARAWLEAFYVRWHDRPQKDRPEGAKDLYELLEDAEGHYVAQVRRVLKVAAPGRS